VFVQATKSSRQNGKTYVSYLVRESFRIPSGPRSRTVCNITDLPPDTRDLIAASLKGQVFLPADQVQLEAAWTTAVWPSLTMAGHASGWENSLRASVRPANADCSKPPFIAACSFLRQALPGAEGAGHLAGPSLRVGGQGVL